MHTNTAEIIAVSRAGFCIEHILLPLLARHIAKAAGIGATHKHQHQLLNHLFLDYVGAVITLASAIPFLGMGMSISADIYLNKSGANEAG